jgi:hypothetical protein
MGGEPGVMIDVEGQEQDVGMPTMEEMMQEALGEDPGSTYGEDDDEDEDESDDMDDNDGSEAPEDEDMQ